MAAGFLIVKRFSVLYDATMQQYGFEDGPKDPIYGIPHQDRPLNSPNLPQYRGIDRQPVRALTFEEAKVFSDSGVPVEATRASELMDRLERSTGREDGWLTQRADALVVWNALDQQRDNYEIIFAREHNDATPVFSDTAFLGCDAAYFNWGHFSCICDALFLPRWHGTDREGIVFKEHFHKLNANGLFDSHEAAADFLQYYLSFDWTERSDEFTSIEVYAVPT